MESLSRPPHRRKHSSTADVFSRKNPYDDVLLFNGGERKSLEAREYAEIFSGSSSIPVLDLSGLDVRVGSGDLRRSSRLDYSNIFGGFNDVAVPYEELVNGSTKKTKMRNPTETKLPSQESSSLNSSGKPKRSSDEASVDEVKKKFNMSFNRTSQRNTDASNGKTHVTQLHDVTGFTYFVDGTSRPQKTENDPTVHSLKREVSRTWSFSAEVETVKGKGGLNCDKKNIPDKSHNVNDVNLKSNFSKVPSLSSGPLNINGNNDPGQSRASKFVPKKDALEKIGGECSPPYFGENFDENSVAAASAAALKKAIDQAQESIRLAKMVMDRKKEGYQNGSKPKQRGRPKVSDKEGKSDRASNGSQKNNSKAKYEELDPTLTIFNGIDGKFTPSLPHDDTFFNAAKVEVERVWDNVEPAKEHGTAFSEGDIVSNGSQSKSLYIDGKVGSEKAGDNVEASEMNSQGAEFPVLAANECEITNLVSGGLDTGRDNLEQREVSVHHMEGPGVVAEQVERALDTSQRMRELEKSVEEADQFQDTFDHAKGPEDEVEKILDTPPRYRGQEKVLGEADKNSGVCQDDEVSEERENHMDDKGKQETAEMLNVECVTEINSDFYSFLNESCNLGGNETKREENVHVAKTNDDEAQLWFESEEQLREALEDEINETKTGVFPEMGEVEKSFNETLEPEIDNQKENHAHDGDERKVSGELEQNSVEDRYMNTSECEVPEAIEMEARNCAEVQKGVFCDSEENLKSHNKCQNAENAYEEHIVENVDVNSNSVSTIFSEAQTNDTTGTCISETQGSCNVDLDDESEDYHRVLGNSKENATASEMIGTFSAIDKDEDKISGTETLRRIASEEIFIESTLHDDFDSFSSDGKMEDVPVMDADPEEELPEDEDPSNTTSEIHDVAQEYTSQINKQDLPQVYGSDIRTAEFELIHVRQVSEQTSESDEGSASTSNHENASGFSAHESEERAENANDLTPNDEIKDECEPVSNETKFSEERSEGLYSQTHSEPEEMEKPMESKRAGEKGVNKENNTNDNLLGTSSMEEKDAKGDQQNFDKNDYQQRIEAIKKGREREKDRIVVERAIREARERAFAEARERAERAAVERAAAEARQRAMAEAREKKSFTEAKLRAERAAVERATAEARERALEKAMSQKTYTEVKTQVDGYPTERSSGSRNNGLKHSFSSSDLENGTESAQRRKARLERHQRIMERAAKALAEKNTRDLLVQKEQAERNRIAESLDAEIKRWATGKERNLRALLSTLQYILGPDSGWQPIPLTEIVTTAAVKKAYRKATLYVHPDKLQQRGASIHQKYLCEKVFDLLKAAWNRFNSDER